VIQNIKKMICDVVLGLQFGDEGKGKVVHQLIKNENYDLCVRFNGGPNAGHSIYVDEKKIVLHMIPCGILNSNTKCYISSNCVLDKTKFFKEIVELREKYNISVNNRIYISNHVHLITEENIQDDISTNKIGTTGSGIGPTYSKKALRTNIRVEDYSEEFESYGIILVNPRKFWTLYNWNKVLCEGAQGFELDINWCNHYPYCTSSTCTLAGAIDCGIPLKSIRNVYGVAKIYETYVGTMKFQDENDIHLNKIQEVGKEFGSTTGRKRQCNYLDITRLNEALLLNSVNKLIINKCDIVKEVNIYKVYYENMLMEFTTFDEMKEFIYKKINLNNNDIIFSSSPYKIESEEDSPKLEKKLSYLHISYENLCDLGYIM
jgi:adenylosuccinate synthase